MPAARQRSHLRFPVAAITLAALVAAFGTAARAADDAAAQKERIVFVAGGPSHGYAAHEHYAGCTLLAKGLEEGMPGDQGRGLSDGWPTGPTALDGADAIVRLLRRRRRQPAYCSTSTRSIELMKKGVGLACFHYAVEVPKGKPASCMLNWIGGYFETFWSVNPHWKAEFKTFPDHPIARGVKPFAIDDEWYYHMRFPREHGRRDADPHGRSARQHA